MSSEADKAPASGSEKKEAGKEDGRVEMSESSSLDVTPFEGMKLSSFAPLQSCSERTKCPKCGKPRKYFCYDCVVPLTSGVPHVELPMCADIVHYYTEQRSKSTSMHGALLAPQNVRLVEYPSAVDAMKEPYDPKETIVLYPAEDAVTVAEMPAEELARVKRVVLLDSQWSNAPRMLRHRALSGLRHVKIQTAKTAFWRYQRHGQDHLATVEALYWFMREVYEAREHTAYTGQFDDLLWYFAFNYAIIQQHYNSRRDRSFVHINGYIRYKTEEENKDDEAQPPANKKPRE